MPFQPGTSNRTALRYAIETVLGTTPASPAFKELRYTGESLNFNQSSISSNEIRADRNIGDTVRVDADVAGDVNFEMSFSTFDDMLAAALCTSWPVVPSGTAPGTAALTAGAGTLTAATYYYQVTAIGASGAESLPTSEMSLAAGANTGINVNWTTAAGATGYRIYGRTIGGAKRFLAQVGVVTTWLDNGSVTPGGASIPVANTSVIRNGVELKSFTFQKHFQDLAIPIFQNFTGCRIGGMSMDFQPGQILTGSFTLMGMNSVQGTSQNGGATISYLGTGKDVMNSVSNLLNLQKNGSAMTASILKLGLNMANNLRGQKAIGTLGSVGIALGKFDVSGDIEIYFENGTEYTDFLNNTAFSISWRLRDPASPTKYYDILLPKVKFETGTIVAGGLDQDMKVAGTYRATYDSTEMCEVRITKYDV
jgi:hypothetical protein